MKKFGIIALVVTAIIIIGGVFLLSKNTDGTKPDQPPPPITKLEYFWGNGCPHCKVVQDFLDSWENTDKLEIDKKEVWYNKANSDLMKQRVLQCNLDINNTGVPFLVTPDGKCINGDQPIIEYFKSIDFGSES